MNFNKKDKEQRLQQRPSGVRAEMARLCGKRGFPSVLLGFSQGHKAPQVSSLSSRRGRVQAIRAQDKEFLSWIQEAESPSSEKR